MANSYFFYDLETSGLNPRDDRIMQFAGQRTNENFQPIGEPYNILVTLAEDTLPSIGALMVTSITPQQTVADGYSEADFCKLFIEEVATPGTTIIGFNNIRFDDEFIRAILWRNYHDPYSWCYADERSRWDMLDVIRMTRALRPDGIEWPVVDGKAVNKLELIARENNILHEKAHDALSDVEALIGVSKLVATAQPQLFDYLLKMRSKNAVKELVNLETPKPFVYSSGRYDQQFDKTTVAIPILETDYGNVLVFDLRYSPEPFLGMTKEQLKKILETPFRDRYDSYRAIPVKKLQYNRAPAVAPLGVLEQGDGWQRIAINKQDIQKNHKILAKNQDFVILLGKVYSEVVKPASQYTEAEHALYDGFVGNRDSIRMEVVRNLTRNDIASFKPTFDDNRLTRMWPQYKARNFPFAMTPDEAQQYDQYRTERLSRQSQPFLNELSSVIKKTDLTDQQKFVIEELQLWYESVMPVKEDYEVDLDL